VQCETMTAMGTRLPARAGSVDPAAVALVLVVIVLLVLSAPSPFALPVFAPPIGVRGTVGAAAGRVKMELLPDASGNEALVVVADVGGRRSMLFMVDTAYAGPPVISTSCLAADGEGGVRWRAESSVGDRYRAVVDALRSRVGPNDRHAALAHFVARSGCRSFVSGCTMRLMGIAETTETQADLLLCDAVSFLGEVEGSATAPSADVFVTNPLPTSVHILTVDFLMHRSPCLLLMREGAMVWRADRSAAASFHMLTPTFVGGAFRVPMEVGGATLQIVVDTGAAASLSLSPSAVQRLRTCSLPSRPGRATQVGVNGERVCSDVFRVRVRIGNVDAGEVDAFANSHDVEGADGYAGLALLRAVDMYVTPSSIGVRPSGLPTSRSSAVSEGMCGATPFAPRCSLNAPSRAPPRASLL
jgi:hypothetical protein